MSDILLKIPFAYMITGKLNDIVVLGFLLFFALSAFSLYEGKRGFKRRIYFFLAGLIVFTGTTVFDIINRNNNELEITFLDVGQGDSIYGEYKGFNFIIDGGGNILKKEGGDTGINVLSPHIKGSGYGKIDAVFVSHTDADHVKGIIEIMDIFNIENIYISAANPENEYYNLLLKKAYENDIAVYKMKKNDYLNYDRLKIKCLYPFDDEKTDINNASLVLKAEIDERSFLFTGDIEKETEDKILKSNEDISCDIIKIAHHGSDTSTTEEFLDKACSETAVVSAGKNNMYNHPSQAVVKRIENKNIKFYNTARDGAVIIRTNGKSLKIKTMKGGYGNEKA